MVWSYPRGSGLSKDGESAVDVDGIIHPVTVEILTRAFDQAARQNAEVVLIRLNTPGGLMEAMRESLGTAASSLTALRQSARGLLSSGTVAGVLSASLLSWLLARSFSS